MAHYLSSECQNRFGGLHAGSHELASLERVYGVGEAHLLTGYTMRLLNCEIHLVELGLNERFCSRTAFVG